MVDSWRFRHRALLVSPRGPVASESLDPYTVLLRRLTPIAFVPFGTSEGDDGDVDGGDSELLRAQMSLSLARLRADSRDSNCETWRIDATLTAEPSPVGYAPGEQPHQVPCKHARNL